ncbi:MAG TPA: hypothetical protein VGR35_16785 [Tepidisphaeraceae bacterium]|nr:hypothetical protein [Tepidisphaeraceae bacterium]
MAQGAAMLLTVGCCLAGAWMLIAVWRKRPVIGIPSDQQHMTAGVHVLAALLFFGMPVKMYCRWLPWQAVAAYVLMGAAAIVYFCIVDVRERRRRRAG